MQNKLSIKSAFAAVLCISLAVFLADRSLYSGTLNSSIWNIPFGRPSSIWTALSYNYQMEPVDGNKARVSSEIRWFQKHQDYITELTHNAQPYIFYVYQQLKKRHMPAELALLPMVESSYVPFASSNVGATGLWQMMPDTASGLGVKSQGPDGRRNVITSTNAALTYLAYLHKTFGSWSLALAAYNAGEGTVENAIKANEKRGLPTDFWSLHLPKQTEEYVPKLLALAAIVENPQRYNVQLEPVPNKAFFGAIKVDKKINLAAVAKLSNSDPKTLHKLNPGIKSASAPIPVHAKYVLVPLDKLPVLQANLHNPKLAQNTIASVNVKTNSAKTVAASTAAKKEVKTENSAINLKKSNAVNAIAATEKHRSVKHSAVGSKKSSSKDHTAMSEKHSSTKHSTADSKKSSSNHHVSTVKKHSKIKHHSLNIESENFGTKHHSGISKKHAAHHAKRNSN